MFLFTARKAGNELECMYLVILWSHEFLVTCKLSVTWLENLHSHWYVLFTATLKSKIGARLFFACRKRHLRHWICIFWCCDYLCVSRYGCDMNLFTSQKTILVLKYPYVVTSIVYLTTKTAVKTSFWYAGGNYLNAIEKEESDFLWHCM